MGLALGLLAVMAGLLAASETAAQAVREGLALCGGSVIPALFPFLVVSRLFVATGSAAALGQLLAPLTRRMLGVSRPARASRFLSPMRHPSHGGLYAYRRKNLPVRGMDLCPPS